MSKTSRLIRDLRIAATNEHLTVEEYSIAIKEIAEIHRKLQAIVEMKRVPFIEKVLDTNSKQ